MTYKEKLLAKRDMSYHVQLSVYKFLANKNGYKIEPLAYIAWLCVDTNKHGIHEIELLSDEETIKVIKNFMTEIEKPLEDMPKCNLCIQFMHRFCGMKNKCPHWVVDKDFSSIDTW